MTSYTSLLFNQLAKADPTRTLTLRSRWAADWKRRIKELQRVIRISVVDNDGFGLSRPDVAPGTARQLPAQVPSVHAALEPASSGSWAYRWSHEKVDAFMQWLKEMEERGLLEITYRSATARPMGEPWSNVYVRSAYQSGIKQALAEVKKNDKKLAQWLGMPGGAVSPMFDYTGGAVSAIMMQPFHADRLALAYTRAFDELKGVTAEMDRQISRILTRALAEGKNPREIGALIADRVDKVGLTRGTLIARTETIHVHQQAALNEYYSLEEQTGEVILVQWSATQDSRTRDTHMARHGRVYTKEEAYPLLGEPNCRCALKPWIPATMGMPAKATDKAREICRRVLEEEGKRNE